MKITCRLTVQNQGDDPRRHLQERLAILSIHGTPLERVSIYKLLGVFISADLRWETHIEYIISKAASRLYFL